MFLIIPPPSQPSPKGEGAKSPFPLGGNKKGGFNIKELIICYHNSEVLHSYRDSMSLCVSSYFLVTQTCLP
jgi:hypothetical protein